MYSLVNNTAFTLLGRIPAAGILHLLSGTMAISEKRSWTLNPEYLFVEYLL